MLIMETMGGKNGKGMTPFHLAMAKLRENTNVDSFEICKRLWNELDQQDQFHMLDIKHWDGESQKNLKQDLVEFQTNFNPEKDSVRQDFFCEIIRFAKEWISNYKLPYSPCPFIQISSRNKKII